MTDLLKTSNSIVNRRSLTTRPRKSAQVDLHDSSVPRETEADLKELFKDELNELREQVSRQTYDETLAAAEERIKKQLEDSKATLEKDYQRKRDEHKQALHKLETIIESAEKQHANSIASTELEAILLTMECLYKLAGKKEIYADFVTHAFQEVKKRAEDNLPINIRISSQDAELVQDLPVLKKKNVRLVIESYLEPGSFYMETGFSTIDLGIITRLDQVRDALINTFQGKFHGDS